MNSVAFDMLEPEADQQIETFLMLQGNGALSVVLNIIYITKVKRACSCSCVTVDVIFQSPGSVVLCDVLLAL